MIKTIGYLGKRELNVILNC